MLQVSTYLQWQRGSSFLTTLIKNERTLVFRFSLIFINARRVLSREGLLHLRLKRDAQFWTPIIDLSTTFSLGILPRHDPATDLL